MAKCNDCGQSLSSGGLCTRCDMHRRMSLPAGCPEIPGEYRPGDDGTAAREKGVFDWREVVGYNSSPSQLVLQGEWDNGVRLLEADF